MRLKGFALLLIVFPLAGLAAEEPKTVGEVLDRAMKLSQLTQAGGAPFRLKARVAEIDSPDSDYKAEIEEYWVAPDKWRRTIKTPDFSQTLIVNGSQTLEQHTGDYYPHWLLNAVIATIDLAPAGLPGLNLPYRSMSGMLQHLLGISSGAVLSQNSEFCSRAQEQVGIPPVHNTIFTSICFRGNPLLLKGVTSPGYHADFDDFKKFKGKQAARRIKVYLEPGTVLDVKIDTLEELRNPDDSMFTVPQATPARERVQRVRVSEAAARAGLLKPPEIVWAPVRDGKLSGSLSIFVSVDKEGKVRETWPLNSDNPFPQDQARKEVMQWRFKPFEVDGVAAQMETVLTFAFQVKKQ